MEPRVDPEGTVDLLDEDQAHQLMWIRHFAKRDLSIASFMTASLSPKEPPITKQGGFSLDT